METTEEEVEKLNKEFEERYDKIRELELSTEPTPINESIAIANSMATHALAIMKEVALWKGDIAPIYRHGYAKEKIEALMRDLEAMERDLKVPEHVVFRDITFDPSTHQWKKITEVI